MTAPKVDQVVDAYMKLRRDKERIQNEMKALIKPIEEKMQKLDSWLMQHMQREGVESIRTAHGTAYIGSTQHAAVADWDALLKFILETEGFDLLEKRVSKTAVQSRLRDEDSIPPGVNWFTKREVFIRKPVGE